MSLHFFKAMKLWTGSIFLKHSWNSQYFRLSNLQHKDGAKITDLLFLKKVRQSIPCLLCDFQTKITTTLVPVTQKSVFIVCYALLYHVLLFDKQLIYIYLYSLVLEPPFQEFCRFKAFGDIFRRHLELKQYLFVKF